MVFRFVSSLYTLVLRNLRVGSLRAQRRKYSETRELLKQDLRDYVDQVEKHLFDLGAVKAYSTKIDELEVYSQSESFSSNDGGWRFRWFRDSSASRDRLIASSFWLFEKGYDAIRSYVSGEDLNPSYVPAFEALERFYVHKEVHERCLRRGFDHTPTETGIAAVLAQHLLSQLISYPSNYFLNNASKGKPDGCPCGCGELIHFGITHVGSPALFHGYADIVLFPGDKNLFENFENSDKNSSAIFSFKLSKGEKEMYGHRKFEMNGLWDAGSEIEDDWDAGSEIEEDFVMGEVKKHDTPLRHTHTFRQLCKQAISLSLCKQNRMHNNPQNYEGQPAIIPLCALTKESYEIALYDTENDFLLRSVSPLYLFDDDVLSLPISSIVDLWFVINHSLFCTKQTDETVNVLKGTCNLYPQLGKDLLTSVIANSTWMFRPDYTTQVSSYLPDGEAKRADKRSHVWRKIGNFAADIKEKDMEISIKKE